MNRPFSYPSSRGSLAASQFQLDPFQLLRVNLEDSRVVEGLDLPGVEGTGLHVLSTDLPTTIGLVINSDRVLSYPVYAGLTIRAPFKGLIVRCPGTPTSVGGTQGQLRAVLFRGDSFFAPTDARPNTSGTTLTRKQTDTATLQEIEVFIPQGSRTLERLTLVLGQTGITAASAFTGLGTTTGLNIGALNYLGNPWQCWGQVSAPAANFVQAVFEGPFVLDSNARRLFVTVNGTNMAGASVAANAVFQ